MLEVSGGWVLGLFRHHSAIGSSFCGGFPSETRSMPCSGSSKRGWRSQLPAHWLPVVPLPKRKHNLSRPRPSNTTFSPRRPSMSSVAAANRVAMAARRAGPAAVRARRRAVATKNPCSSCPMAWGWGLTCEGGLKPGSPSTTTIRPRISTASRCLTTARTKYRSIRST